MSDVDQPDNQDAPKAPSSPSEKPQTQDAPSALASASDDDQPDNQEASSTVEPHPSPEPRPQQQPDEQTAEPKSTAKHLTFRGWLSGQALPPWALLFVGLIAPIILVLINAWIVRKFTVDDSYIAFRYAENLANGHGLVYNLGERVEGYTNFLWTVLLAGTVKLGATTETAAKVMGGGFAAAALVPTYLISRRIQPFTNVPCLATWLLASSFIFTGYAVFGLESGLFLLLILSGTHCFLREEAQTTRFPVSGLMFALAALTRPEAPLFLGMLLIWHADSAFTRRNALRMLLFALPVVAHLLWRHSYYGAWLPNTLLAKTGDLNTQLRGGSDYVHKYAQHAGASLWLGVVSIVISIVHRRKSGLAIGSMAIAFGVYVILVGGDWMPYYRFLAPAEPFAFLLVDDAARFIAARRDRIASLSLAAFLAIMGLFRAGTLGQAQRDILAKDKAFWDDAAGRTADWLVNNAEPGPIAIADIGYVGYKTGFPVVDMLGLLSTEVSHLPGGYTRKVGRGYADIMFSKNPRYFLILSSNSDCRSPSVPSSRVSFSDVRFRANYRLKNPITLKGGGAWCIYEKKSYP